MLLRRACLHVRRDIALLWSLGARNHLMSDPAMSRALLAVATVATANRGTEGGSSSDRHGGRGRWLARPKQGAHRAHGGNSSAAPSASYPSDATTSDASSGERPICFPLWAGRWDVDQRDTARDFDLPSDAEDVDDEPGAPSGDGSHLLPFGVVLGASGRSVRVTVSCSAGLAARLPIWGLHMRGDAEWAVTLSAEASHPRA